jgi:lipopolysaccharide/colanic/teichoic acid biosynthesis glycosyltransferase
MLPSSRGSFRIRFSAFDLFWAAATPLLALYFRDAYILTANGAPLVLLYCGISLGCSLAAFLAFRLSDGISRYFSVHDAFNVVKAVLASGLMTSILLFTLTRLEGIPRSTPVLQFLLLVAGLLTARTVMMLLDHNQHLANNKAEHSSAEHIIIIGTNRLSSLYIKFIHAYSPVRRRIIGVLDHKKRFIGRAICGVPVVASPQELDSVIEEFAVHGISADRVIIGGDEHFLSEDILNHVRCVCSERGIALDFLPDLIGLNNSPTPRLAVAKPVTHVRGAVASPSRYFMIKRLVDFAFALIAILLLAPLFITSAILILFDLGSPVLFWQQRIGQGHKNFFLYKFRTLRPPFDAYGQPVPQSERLSLVGRCLRKSRIDELPQLFSVLVGDMSLVGPRPLLPHDQPSNTSLRLSVRPGITGWAQIHGGNLVTTEEKGALDEWYIRHASLWLDLKIALLTLRFCVTGERRSQWAVDEAYAERLAVGRNNLAAYGGSQVHDINFAANENLSAIKIVARSGQQAPVTD